MTGRQEGRRVMMDHRAYRRIVASSRRLAKLRRRGGNVRARRRAWLAALASVALVMTLTGLSLADPRPLIPPLACCNDYRTPCPSVAASCIPLPYMDLTGPGYTGAPATKRWNLTIQQAIQLAIANSEAVRNLGLVEAASKNDIVRSVITTYDPVQAALKADSQWGIFDPLWTTSMQWYKQDIPPGTSFSGIGVRPPMLDTADFGTGLEQLLPLGTRVRVDSVTNYLFNPNAPAGPIPNPQYFSYTQFGVNQPLMQGSGVGVTMAPIKIAAAQAEQTNWSFKQEMLALVRSVETTYWSLYAQQQNLRAIDEILPLFHETVRLRQEQAGASLGNESEVFRAQSDLLLYEQRRMDTESRIAEQQLVLRNLMGISPSDDTDIMTLAVPETGRPLEPLQDAVMTAINRRPDVLRQRLAVYVAQQERVLADNSLKPRLDLNGIWRMNGLSDNLGQSWAVQTNNDYRDWQLGALFEMPLGRRQGFSNLRAADVKISRERAMLDQVAHQASFEVADAYRRINWVSQQRQLVVNRAEALKKWRGGAQAQFENPPPGMSTAFALELYLQNLRDVLEASTNAHALLADYNSALARLDEVKGTLLDRRLVQISGDLSEEVPADLPNPLQQPNGVLPSPPKEAPGAPAGAPSAPAQQEGAGATVEAPESTMASDASQFELQPLPPLDEAVELPSAAPTPTFEYAAVPAPAPALNNGPTPAPAPAYDYVVIPVPAPALEAAPTPAPAPNSDFEIVAAPEPTPDYVIADAPAPIPDYATASAPGPTFDDSPVAAPAPSLDYANVASPGVEASLALPPSVRPTEQPGLVSDIGAPAPAREMIAVAPDAADDVWSLQAEAPTTPPTGGAYQPLQIVESPVLQNPAGNDPSMGAREVETGDQLQGPAVAAPVEIADQDQLVGPALAQPLRMAPIPPITPTPIAANQAETPLRMPHSILVARRPAPQAATAPKFQYPTSVAPGATILR